jgi:hypothetical protein
MQDNFGLGSAGVSDVQMFFNVSTTATSNWVEWKKPRGKSMVGMWAIGGGGGGGGGAASATTSAAGGGSGGGSGGLARVILPAFLVPDVLWISVGAAGIGGASAGAGGNGGISYVSMGEYPLGALASYTAASNLFLMSSAAGGGGGAAGTNGGAAGGSAATVPVITSQIMGGYAGWWFGNLGLIGGAGGAGTGPVAPVNYFLEMTGLPVSGGAGGGSKAATSTSGANIIDNGGRFVTITGGTSGTTNPGDAGITLWNPFQSCGGAGGAGFSGNIGGGGGGGGLGSGGGGGGGGTTGGIGGMGGGGLVIMMAW